MQNNILSMLLNSQNPMQVLGQVANFNPEIKQVLDIYQQKSPDEFREYVKNICKTQNIDINSIVRQYNLPIKF